YRKYTDTAALGTLASLFLFMIIVPTVIYNEENILGFFKTFGNFHTVAFHNLVPLYFLITVALRLYDFEPKRDMRVLAVFLAVYVAVATVLSMTLKVNFHNLLKCNLEPVENIRLMMIDKIGRAGHAIYIIILFFLTILFSYAAYFLTKLAVSVIEKRKKKA
ncbi:MAG: hypothetical protein IKA64_03425, partial [Clostridia bacterium]|nr:hypothetical protein [Clostridia bacterium]